MAYLAPSLKNLFNQLDAMYPGRDRRTDGWYRAGTWTGHDTDHMAAPSGVVRAVDIDKDGIWAWWVATMLSKRPGVARYVIYDHHWAHARDGFRWGPYSGTPNPHIDHIHLSIEHTSYAENWSGNWLSEDSGGTAHGGSMSKPDSSAGWDFANAVDRTGGKFSEATTDIAGYAKALNGLRLL